MNTYPTDEQAAQMAADMTYPVVVYGTLRPGFGNDRLWRDRARAIHDGTVYVTGFRLAGHGFPYAIPSEGETIVGALIVPEPWTYDAVLADMDMLEGVPHHYIRDLVTAETPDGYRVAWMYVPATRYGSDTRPVRRDSHGRYDWALGTEARAVVTGGAHGWRSAGPDVEDVWCIFCGADMTDRAAAQPCPGIH